MRRVCTVLLGLTLFAVLITPRFAAAQQQTSPSTWGQIKALYHVTDVIRDRSLSPQAMVGVAPYAGELIGPWYWPHYAVYFAIPHSTYRIQRICAVPTTCCDGGIQNWTVDRDPVGDGKDRFMILVPKTFRLKYYYLTNAEFNRFFFIWCTY